MSNKETLQNNNTEFQSNNVDLEGLLTKANSLPVLSEITPESIGAAPMYTYGTADLEAGVTPLASGMLHFVYEGDGGGSDVATISFTIEQNGTAPSGAFTAEDDMTWEEWISSGYNTTSAHVSGNIIAVESGSMYGLNYTDGSSSVIVRPADAIVANRVYWWGEF